jgi:anti-sigma-K factor RskA
MTRMAQPEIHDLAAAYALDALDAEDRWTYERHLDTCERCRKDVSALREGAEELAYGAGGPEPPGELRERILAAARAEPRTATVVPMRRRRWLFPTTAVAAVAAACLAIGLGLWANSLRGETTERVVPMDGGGSLVIEGDQATLVACVDDPPAGKTYEAWVIEGNVPRPAGLFAGGCQHVQLEEPVAAGDTVAVTLEAAGGVDRPTTDPLMSANV